MTGIALILLVIQAPRDTFFMMDVHHKVFWSDDQGERQKDRFLYWFKPGLDGYFGVKNPVGGGTYQAINDSLDSILVTTGIDNPLDSLAYFARGMGPDWLWGMWQPPDTILRYRHFPFSANAIDNDGGLTRFDTMAFFAMGNSGALYGPWNWPFNSEGLSKLKYRVCLDLTQCANGGFTLRWVQFGNEPDCNKRMIQWGFWNVYVNVDYAPPPNDTPIVVQIVDTQIVYSNATYRIRITRMLDSTTVGGTRVTNRIDWDSLAILKFVFDSLGEEQTWYHKLTDTVVCWVRPNSLVGKFRTHYWGPAYMADSILPQVQRGVDSFNLNHDPDVRHLSCAWSFSLANPGPWGPWDSLPNDFRNWVGIYWYNPSRFKAGGDTLDFLKMQRELLEHLALLETEHDTVFVDLFDYHVYTAFDFSGDSGNPEYGWFDPYDTLKTILDSLKNLHQSIGIIKPVIFTEFGGQTLPDGQDFDDVGYERQAKALVRYYDVFRRYRGDQNLNIIGTAYFALRGGCVGEYGFHLLAAHSTVDTERFDPKPAYYAFLNYLAAYRGDKARGDGDTLLASRHSEATFGPGNKMDAVYTEQPPVRKYWVAFPFRQYDPAQKALVLKGIRVLRIDTLGNADSVVNLTGSPYNKVDQLALAGADNAPCVAFTTSDSGNIYYAYIGASVSRTLLWRNDSYRDSAYFPLLENEGNYIHLVFYGKSSKPEYGNGIHWMKFTYNDPGNPSVHTSTYYGEIPDWLSFDLNSDNKPWIAWEHGDSVYLVRHTGLAWGDFKTVASSYAKWPDISMRGPDTAWVAWHKFSVDSVFVRGYMPYGLISKFNGPVSRAKADSSFPQIEISGTTVFVLWADSNIVQVGEVSPNPNSYKPWSYDTRLAKGVQSPLGYSFTNALLESTPLHSLYPDLVARSSNRIMALWNEGEYDAHRVRYGLEVVE